MDTPIQLGDRLFDSVQLLRHNSRQARIAIFEIMLHGRAHQIRYAPRARQLTALPITFVLLFGNSEVDHPIAALQYGHLLLTPKVCFGLSSENATGYRLFGPTWNLLRFASAPLTG